MAYETFAELADAAEEHGSLGAAALDREALETEGDPLAIRARMARSLGVMREAAAAGLTGEVRSRSGLVGGDAAKVAASHAGPVGGVFANAVATALAVAEMNASMGRIVAAPTGGASGVVPGVLLAIGTERRLDDDAIVDALFAAAGVGAVLASHVNLSGAAAGCQAETGAAAAMAAAAATELLGGTPEQAGNAASLALQGLLGLVCDPVGGLVEVPCVSRNATATGVALAATEMALSGVEFPIPFDEVAEAMAHIGRAMPARLRETARGGLAASPTARELAEGLGSLG